ncbi:MAG: hypothetical protein II899_12035 [Bacteroidales bacterium]|nr:hypothetical protein [Bacteroidales bacterium]
MDTNINKNTSAETGKYGPVYRQFAGKPKEAIKFLREKKNGECIAALHRSDIGDIDIVWGEVSDPIKHKGYGLAHIIDKHEIGINKLGFDVEDFIPIVVQFGNFNLKKSDSQKKVFESETFRFVVALENGEDGKTKKWLLSAFDIIKRPK